MKTFYVYILASRKRGTLYIGITNDIARRVHEHRTGTAGSFTRRYGVFRLVYFETFSTAVEAIRREKMLKRWKRQWKIDLIEKDNPEWFALPRPEPVRHTGRPREARSRHGWARQARP